MLQLCGAGAAVCALSSVTTAFQKLTLPPAMLVILALLAWLLWRMIRGRKEQGP
jgi:hypothetical protein